MTEIEIFESGKKVPVPTRWDEMTDRQIRRIFWLDSKAIRQRWTVGQLRLAILTELLGVKITPESFRKGLDKASENLSTLADVCLQDIMSDGARIKYDYVHNPLPVIRPRLLGKQLYAPADLLSDISFSDFRHASDALGRFLKSSDAEDLDECIAILYRPWSRRPNRTGRHVVVVSSDSIRQDIRRISKLNGWKKNLILAWFSSTLDFLQNADIDIDGETVQLGRLFAKEGASASPAESFGWGDLLIQIAKDGALGNMDSVDEAPLMYVLSIMWSNYKESKRHEKARKAKKA